MGATSSYDTDDNMTVYDITEGKIITSYSVGTCLDEQKKIISIDEEKLQKNINL